MRCGIITHIGLVREENQDEVRAKDFGSNILAVVCDGMGGERAGKQASSIAVREVFDHFEAGYHSGMTHEDIRALLVSSVSAANSVIYTTARMDYKSYGMGTTCVAAFVQHEWIHIANVGDSRAYLLEDGVMRQVTSDHTVVNMLYQQGKITREQMASHPQRNMLTQAVGVERVVKPDYFRIPHKPDFTLLLCSDGLSSYCSDAEISDTIRKYPYEEVPDALIVLSLQKGGRDNISLAIVTQ